VLSAWLVQRIRRVFVRREFCPKTQEAFMKVHKSVVMGLLALILAWAVPAFGQSDRGSITGTVTDPNGGVVADAKVTATSLTTGEVREATTSSEGNYTLPELKATPYKLVVEAQGFKTATIDTVIVAVQVTRHADIKLEIGQLGESVTVTSDTPVLQTDTPVHQTNITERQIKELPLTLASESGGGRSPISFIFLDSSVTTTGYSGQTTGTNGFNFRVNGGQGLGTDILIDGAATRRAENGTFFSEVAPNPNAFQEFTVSTAQYSAEFGNSSGGVINLTIKSGSSKFHGEAFDIVRNEVFNARPDLVRLANKPKPRDRQQDFGFNIGGPVILPHFGEGGPTTKNLNGKTFFFFNYGGYRTSQQENVDITVPTVRMRNGDFGELLTDPYILNLHVDPANPNSPLRFPGGVQIFDSRQAPGQRNAIPLNNLAAYQNGAAIDPVGLNIIRLFPLPTRAGVFHNFTASTTAPTNSDNYVGKVDQVISDRQRLAFTFSTRKLTAIKGGFPRLNADYPNLNVWNQSFRSYYVRLQHDYTFSPTLLNHFNAGFSRSFVQNRNVTRGQTATSLGVPANATQNLGLPRVDFPGYGDPVTSIDPRAAQGAGSTNFDNQDGDNAVELTDFVTLVHGKHTFKTGADVRFQQLNDSNHFDIGGWFNFRSNQTANTNDATQGWPLASLVTGATEFSFNSVQSIDPGMRTFDPSAFFQDDLKLTPRLTLNLGIRYDIPYPRYEHLNKYRAFDPTVPNPQAGGRLGAIVDAKGGPGALQSRYRSIIKPDYSDWGPRVGFAYSVNSKTVVRGGYGIYYAPLVYNDFGRAGAIGYSPASTNIDGGLDAAPDLFLRNYRAAPTPNPSSQVIGQLDTGIDYFNVDFKVGRTAQYSLDLQRELPKHFAISVSYIGNKGSRLRSNFNSTNILPFNALKLGDPLLRKRLDQVTPLERAYAQSVGITLPASNDAVYPGFGNAVGAFAGTVSQALRPFPQYSRSINNLMESQGQSSYNALKIDLQRRFSQGIQAGFSYTYSKLITDAAEDLFGATPLSGVVQNPYDRKSLRTIAPGSFPHSLVFNYIIELPLGKGKRYLNHGALVDRLVGGFQFSGVQRYRSGAALVPFIAGGARDFLDLFGVGGNLRPNIVSPITYTNNNAAGLGYQYFNTSSFVRPPEFGAAPAFTTVVNGQTVVNPDYAAYYANPSKFFGNAAPAYNNFRGQPFFAEDFSLLKKTRITETTTLELGAEMFNAFNRGRFDYPGLDLNDTVNFGRSSRTGDINSARKIQVRARFIF
jgi:hypothetical protein